LRANRSSMMTFMKIGSLGRVLTHPLRTWSSAVYTSIVLVCLCYFDQFAPRLRIDLVHCQRILKQILKVAASRIAHLPQLAHRDVGVMTWGTDKEKMRMRLSSIGCVYAPAISNRSRNLAQCIDEKKCDINYLLTTTQSVE